MQEIKHTTSLKGTFSHVLAALWGVCMVFCAASVVHAQPAGVGQITLLIGKVSVERAGAISPLESGAAVQEGDIFHTAANGQAHIRFVDGGLVSIRPNSVFHVQEFRYDPAHPAASTIRLTLQAGGARAISGAGAQAAKERFRLNTPLVAIGVKGTDFFTQVVNQSTRVTVNEGAIVMAPFDQTCRVDGLGACSGGRARELRADMVGQALVYRSGSVDPSLQPTKGGASDGEKLMLLDRQTRDQLEVSPKVSKVVTETRNVNDVLPESRMVWGRWANAALAGDRMTVPFVQAMAGNDITVGDGYFFLFRQSGVTNFLPMLDRQVDFRLSSAAAYYQTPANEVAAASVQAGTLGINFGQRTFGTSLAVTAEGLGSRTLQYSGSVDPATGIFLSGSSLKSSQTGNLAGAAALDASHAGYLFRAPLPTGGALVGATLWGRAP